MLISDVLRALGKHPHALARERRTREGPRLLQVWLRAEEVGHLVVLRAHRLDPALLAQLIELAAATEVVLWLVWHHHEPPPTPHPSLDWARAVTALRAEHTRHPAPRPDDVYDEAFTAARVEARGWCPDGHRLGWTVPYWEHARPGCDVAALLQRLTIEATGPAQLRVRLQAAQDGFAAEGRRLTLPDLDPVALAVLGPRLAPTTVERLRRLVCPATAAAVMLGLATDAEARFLAGLRRPGVVPEQITLLAGDYRVPERARPLLRAAILTHQAPVSGQPLLGRPGSWWISPQRLAHLVRRGAALADVGPPPAARPLYGINPAIRFASDLTSHASVTDLR